MSILKSCQPTNEFFESFQYIRRSISKTGKDKPCCSTVQQEVSKMSVEHLVKVSMQPGLLESWINRKWGIQCYRITLMNCLTHFSPGKIFADNSVFFFFFFYVPPSYFFQIEHGLSKEHPQSKKITMRLENNFSTQGGMHSEQLHFLP